MDHDYDDVYIDDVEAAASSPGEFRNDAFDDEFLDDVTNDDVFEAQRGPVDDPPPKYKAIGQASRRDYPARSYTINEEKSHTSCCVFSMTFALVLSVLLFVAAVALFIIGSTYMGRQIPLNVTANATSTIWPDHTKSTSFLPTSTEEDTTYYDPTAPTEEDTTYHDTTAPNSQSLNSTTAVYDVTT